MSIDLGRRLIAAGLVSPEEVEAALFLSVAKGVPFPRVLLDRGAITERTLEVELERVGGLGLRQVAGSPELWARIPRAMCRRLAALPTRADPATGAVDVAAADPLDPHVSSEFGFHLGAPIRVLRAPIAAVEEAIRRLELQDTEVREGARPVVPDRVRQRRVTPPFPHGAPQSSIPPPVVDEAPIPLVRKIGPDGVPVKAGGTLVPPAGAPPLARLAVPAPKPISTIPPVPETQAYPGTGGDRAVRDRRAPVIRQAEGDLPAVSFPSTPPTGEGDRATPPYGTPVYDPVAGYRIAPPAEEAYPAQGRRDDEAPPPPSVRARGAATLPSAVWAAATASPPSPQPAPPATAAGQRRSARPVLGEVPYPATLPASPPGRRSSAPPPPQPDPALSDGGEDDMPPPPAPRRARAPDGGPVLAALEQATSRDEVIRVALRGMRLVARRLAVFAVKRDGFYGWACNVELGDVEALRAVRVPSDQPSILATATATAVYLGPIPATPAHEGLLRVMEHASSDVAAVAVRVAGRPALVLVCDELDDTMIGTRFLGELGRAVGEALARLIVPR